jgi:AraC-like DNA-binding protein
MNETVPVLEFQSVFASGVVAVRKYECRACKGGPEQEEQTSSNDVVFLQRGAFCKHTSRRHQQVIDVNQIGFFSSGSSYRVSHPADCGDEGLIITPDNNVLWEIIQPFHADLNENSKFAFPVEVAPCTSELFKQHGNFARRLYRTRIEEVDGVWFDECAISLIVKSIEAIFCRRSKPLRNDSRQRDLVEAAKEWMSKNLSQRLLLSDIASHVDLSAFHFARTFKSVTGYSVHQYLLSLRLRNCVHRIFNGQRDLTSLALDLGFASHSHLTDTFRREFGVPPSLFRETDRLIEEFRP